MLKIKDHVPKVGPKSGAMNPEPLQTRRHNAAKCWLAGDSLAEFSIVSHLPHDCGDSRITHAYTPKTAVFYRIGQKEKRWKSSDFQRFAVEVRTSWWSAWNPNPRPKLELELELELELAPEPGLELEFEPEPESDLSQFWTDLVLWPYINIVLLIIFEQN